VFPLTSARSQDLKGQELAELLLQYIVIGFSAIGFVAGYWQNSFLLSLEFLAVGTLIAAVVVIPDWGFYNKHPNKWTTLPDDTTERSAPKQAQGGKKDKSKPEFRAGAGKGKKGGKKR
jgi:signal peptidase complex subunit 1